MNTKDEIRLTLIDLMEENQVTGNDLAEAVGVTKQAVSAWRTGKSSIDIENVPSICKYFGITIDDFFGARDDGFTKQLTEAENELLNCFRRSSSESKETILSVARAMAN